MFKNSAKYYDLLYSNKSYNQETEYLVNKIKKLSKSNRILEYGSGSGNHAVILMENGFEVQGVELSKQMHEEALKKGVNSINDNIITYISENKYNCIISMFHVFSYVTNLNDFNKLLSNANKNLFENGILIFDVWYSPSVMNILPSRRVNNFKKNGVELIRESIPKIDYYNNCIDVCFCFDYFDKKNNIKEYFEETHTMRHFSIPEIEYFSTKNGFKIIEIEEMITGQKPSIKTWALTFVLKKVK